MSIAPWVVLHVLRACAAAPQEPLRDAAPPEIAGFRYVPGRVEAGRLRRYAKSNVDGTNPTEVALYVAAEDRLESLKWHPDEPEATLVVAEMDWPVCSVKRFQTYRLGADGARTLVAELETRERREIVVRLGERTLTSALERFPWHSYDFDLASLNVALRFLEEPEGETAFEIVDPVQGPEGLTFAAKGEVFLSYEEEDEHAGLACRRYAIDGPGLELRGGKLWVTRGDETFLAGFEIDLPDEPGMRSGKLVWLANAQLTPAEWERFVVERVLPGK
jgi:hypothetical protein